MQRKRLPMQILHCISLACTFIQSWQKTVDLQGLSIQITESNSPETTCKREAWQRSCLQKMWWKFCMEKSTCETQQELQLTLHIRLLTQGIDTPWMQSLFVYFCVIYVSSFSFLYTLHLFKIQVHLQVWYIADASRHIKNKTYLKHMASHSATRILKMKSCVLFCNSQTNSWQQKVKLLISHAEIVVKQEFILVKLWHQIMVCTMKSSCPIHWMHPQALSIFFPD